MDDKYTELAVKIEGVDVRSKSNTNRIESLEDGMEKIQETQITLVKLANGVDKMADQLVDMKSDIKEIKGSQEELSDKVTTLENRPAQETKQRWDNVSEKLLWLVIGGLAVWVLSQILPNVPW